MFGCAGFMVPVSLWCTEGFVWGLPHILVLGRVFLLCIYLHVFSVVEVVSDVLHPNPLLHFCRWDNLVPICIALALVLLNWGLTDLGPGAQPLLQAAWDLLCVAVLVAEGIGQSFLTSKRLIDIFQA